MSFEALFPNTAEGVTQLRVLNACVQVASAELTIWQRMTKIESVTDKRIRFSIDQVYARLTGLCISTLLYTLRDLAFRNLIRIEDDDYEFIRLTPDLFAIANQPAAEAVPA